MVLPLLGWGGRAQRVQDSAAGNGSTALLVMSNWTTHPTSTAAWWLAQPTSQVSAPGDQRPVSRKDTQPWLVSSIPDDRPVPAAPVIGCAMIAQACPSGCALQGRFECACLAALRRLSSAAIAEPLRQLFCRDSLLHSALRATPETDTLPISGPSVCSSPRALAWRKERHRSSPNRSSL